MFRSFLLLLWWGLGYTSSYLAFLFVPNYTSKCRNNFYADYQMISITTFHIHTFICFKKMNLTKWLKRHFWNPLYAIYYVQICKASGGANQKAEFTVLASDWPRLEPIILYCAPKPGTYPRGTSVTVGRFFIGPDPSDWMFVLVKASFRFTCASHYYYIKMNAWVPN